MGFLLRAFAFVALLVTLVAGAAFALARRDDVSGKVERFSSDQVRGAYDVGSTVAVVAAYREVYKAPPDPAVVRKAYDEMFEMGLKVDKATARRFFRERQKLERDAATPSERFMASETSGVEEARGGAKRAAGGKDVRGSGTGKARKGPGDRDGDGDGDRGGGRYGDGDGDRDRKRIGGRDRDGDRDGEQDQDRDGEQDRDGKQDRDTFESDDDDDDYDESAGESEHKRESGDRFESGTESKKGSPGGSGVEEKRKDQFLSSVSAELSVIRDRISALTLAVGERSDGTAPFAPAGREEVRGREVSLGAPPGSTPAPARFENRDNDSADAASLRSGPGGGGAIEGFYSPW